MKPEVLGVGFLEPFQFITELIVCCKRHSVPSRIRREAVMKQVNAAQLLDVELAGELALQFGRREEMKVEAHMAPVRELDFIFVLAAIVTDRARLLH